jgi:hypothetical protein
MAQAGVAGVVVCAFLPVRPSHPAAVRDLWRWLREPEVARLGAAGLAARVALGVHPRCVPDGGVDLLLEELERLATTGAAAAIGEIGLEAGGAAEADLLLRQLCLAARVELPAVVHTPRAGKAAALDATLGLVREAGIDPARVVVDHLTPELVPRVLAAGAVAGLTVQPGKATPGEVEAVVRRHGAARVVVDSDLSHAPSDPLAVPRVAEALLRAGVDAELVARVTHGNARELFGF